MTNDPTPSKPARRYFDNETVTTVCLFGLAYLLVVLGAVMVLCGPTDRVTDGRINLVVGAPLLVVIGACTQRRKTPPGVPPATTDPATTSDSKDAPQ